MRGVKLLGNGRVDVQNFPEPRLEEYNVILKVKASAICGSDLHSYFAPEESQFIAGHEVAGEIFKIEEPSNLKIGDRVTVHNMIGCGHCEFCRKGDWIFCHGVRILGFSMHGGDAEYLAVPDRNCFLLPDEVTFEQGALLGDAVGTPYRAIKRLGVSGAHTVTLFGLGPVGLGALLILKLLNCKVIAVEVNEYRLDMGKRLGADIVINPQNEDVLSRVKECTNNHGVDVAIDCAGQAITENQALEVVREGGRVAFVGENQSATINPSDQFIRKELTVIGSWYFNAGEYEELISLVHRGLGIEKIVTHFFSLEEAKQAFELFANKQSGKVIFRPH